MAIVWDTIQAAALDEDATKGVITRTGTITDVPAGATSDPAVMVTARAQVLASVGPFYPGLPDFRFRRLMLRPFTTNGFAIQATYERSFTGPETSYILRYKAYASGITTNLVPGLRIPIKVSWEDLTAPIGNRKKVPEDLVTMRFNIPAMSLSVSGLQLGRPNDSYGDYVGYVNDTTWPLSTPGVRSRPKAYWMVWSYDTMVAKYQGYYTWEAQALTRNYADWSETGILRDQKTGKFVKVTDDEIAALNSANYIHGIIKKGNGIVRVGGNPLVSFQTLFGF